MGPGRITDKNLIFRVHSLDLRASFESSSNHHVPILGCPKVRRHINNLDRAGKKGRICGRGRWDPKKLLITDEQQV